MRYINIFSATLTLFLLASNSFAAEDCKPTAGAVLPGTDTATVGIYIDKNGFPQASVDNVIVAPGQKIVFVGPKTFDIFFKNKSTPNGRVEVRTITGVATVEIPRDVFAREDKKNPANKTNNEMVYHYGIRVNGKVTDPEITVRPR